ncbi:tetratricopeptide repeat-containing sensor histidine kinase [Dyadobacter sp. CY345]|uniref:ATP-binding protein n=1 Tax=Dyadobacter sp. CY345 TaxID=2909335 RepID=UPI001F322D78|nr:tetratricopeptide repeat-containing sensor histidine kinase [Dyadobacter sp. CY345]MCF2447130.1 tetratricopeptide repeat-containing sensor histidine kinase [Dyadobacter sp. CY345]
MRAVFLFVLILVTSSAFCQVEKIRELQQKLAVTSDSTSYIDLLNKISLLFYEQNADSTLHYALRAREIASGLEYEKGTADANNNLGIVFDIKGNNQLALRYYNDAYNMYVSQKDSSNIVQTLMNIAMVYNVGGKHQKALVNLDQALSMGSMISHDSITAIVIYNYISGYPEKFDHERKSNLIRKAEKISAKYHDVRLAIAIQQLRADDLIANGQRQKGVLLLDSTLQIALQMELNYLSMDIFIDLADDYLKQSPQKSIDLLLQALEMAEEKSYRTYAKEICKKLYDIYLEKGDKAIAFIYSGKLLRLYERQAEIDKSSGIDYIEYAVKDQELASQKFKADYNRKLFWLAAAICILTLLGILFVLRNSKYIKKTNQVLTTQFRQLESTSEALEKTNQDYAKLIKVVAHDLRNPIGAISSLSSMLQEESLTKEEQSQFIDLIHESSNSCIKLISDLLETDFDFNEAELQKEEIYLPTFLEHTIALLSFRASEKKQQLLLKAYPHINITADRDKLLRVLNNLIGNAIKFSPEQGIIQISARKNDKGIEIVVKDNGLGIPKESAEKLFDPFTSSKRQGTAGERPFGLGLYISKQIVEAHDGNLRFESVEGEGSTFVVFLPF